MLYVPDVAATVSFYERAFGMTLRFMDETQQYAQMETGTVALAFAAESAGQDNSGLTLRPNRLDQEAAAIQIAFVTEEIQEAFDHVVAAGGEVVKPPTQKPWGQKLGCVRDNNGVLIEIGTPQADTWQGN
jgi:predicted enzyme related to lactoylglutathione lyase